MRKSIFSTIIFTFVSVLLFAQDTKKQQDIDAIKSMCGCYKIAFNFSETFSPNDDYKFHDNYKASALEWVFMVEDHPDELVLQHLLVVNDSTIIKHWREDWLYENRKLYQYDTGNLWRYTELPVEQVKGQWTQKVYQVDDSPRYEGSATWVHLDGRHYWESTAYAPLPRREYTKRNDYNLMKRRNRHEITGFGWIHEQDNEKIFRDRGSDSLLAQEKGLNIYTKVADSLCQSAKDWWSKNEPLWDKVRNKWKQEFAKNKDLKLEGKIAHKPLYKHLFSLDSHAKQDTINSIIDKFVK